MSMMHFQAHVLWALLHTSWGMDLSFPSHFKFGAATSAYQVEGGWNADGKGPSIWDRYVDDKTNVTGDVAADSYHLWREDVKAAAEMKLQYYRFSISWSRLLPSGFPNDVNRAGVRYYNNLIDALLAEGIEPVVTIYHWDQPVKIQELGGWTNPLIVKWFGEYARVVYTLYADRVKTWLTINEPNVVCDWIYNTGSFATRIKEPLLAPFLCNKHVMLAHAAAYRIYDAEFRPKFKGKISLVPLALWIEAATPEDEALAELGRQHQLGRYSHPIFSKEGGWPPSVEKMMLDVSLEQGFSESRLPAFTEEEKTFIKGTADFYGMNYYTTNVIRTSTAEDGPGVWFISGSPELQATLVHPPNASYGASPTLPVCPSGIRKMLAWVKKQYGDVNFFIGENGYSTAGHQLDDYDRIHFIREHLEQVLLAIKEDKVSVIGYTVWSLIDCFEWADGYTTLFGVYQVDFESPNRTRTPRLSAHYYACVIKARSLDVSKSSNPQCALSRRRDKRNDETDAEKWNIRDDELQLDLNR